MATASKHASFINRCSTQVTITPAVVSIITVNPVFMSKPVLQSDKSRLSLNFKSDVQAFDLDTSTFHVLDCQQFTGLDVIRNYCLGVIRLRRWYR